MQRVVVIESGFLRTNKKAKGRVVLYADGKKIWLQVEDKRSSVDSPSVLNQEPIVDFKDISMTRRAPAAFNGSKVRIFMLEIFSNDGSGLNVGPLTEDEIETLEKSIKKEQVLEFRQIPSTTETTYSGFATQNDNPSGFVRFFVTEKNLHMYFGDDAEVATAGFPKAVNGRIAAIMPLDTSMTFEIDDFTGGISSETKKHARVGATAALFPVAGLATILIPSKKVTVTTDSRTFELRMAGKGWQLLFVFPAAFLEHVQILRNSIQKAVINNTPKSELLKAEKASKVQEPTISNGSSVVEELGNAAKLLDAGLISRKEFDAIKAKLMG